MPVTFAALAPTFDSVINCDAVAVPTVSLPKLSVPGARLMIVPEPVKGAVCGLPVALSLILRLPFTTPLATGENETEMVQLAPAASVPAQVWVCENPEVGTMLESVRDAVPVFVTVMTWAALLVPLSCVPNVRLVGDSVTAGAAPNAAAEWNRTIRLKIQPAQWRASVRLGREDIQECITGMPRYLNLQTLERGTRTGGKGKNQS